MKQPADAGLGLQQRWVVDDTDTMSFVLSTTVIAMALSVRQPVCMELPSAIAAQASKY